MADVYEIFLHNWANAVAMDTIWLNAINRSAQNQVTEGRCLSPKPARVLNVRWDGMDQDWAHRLFFTLMRAGHQILLIPLYQDVSITTAPSSLDHIYCDTADRRFQDGQTVVIFERGENGRPTNVQFRDVVGLAPGDIPLTVNLVGTYPVGSIVCPLVFTEIMLDAAGTALTDFVATGLLSFVEQTRFATGPSSDYASVPADAYTAANGEDYYLLAFSPNWAKEVGFGMTRAGDAQAMGRDNVVVTRGPRPQFNFRFSCDQATRAEFYDLLQFFDGHRGKQIPFFVANPLTIWNVENMGVAFVDVTRSGDIDDPLLFASYLYLEMDNGDIYIRAITNVTNNAGLNRLAVTLPGGLVANDVKRATTAHLCRFKSDALHEEWYTNTVCTVLIEVEECLNEAVEVTL